MGLSNYIHRIEQMDQLIRLKATGSPDEFAKKIGISERWLYEQISELKALGAPIRFDKIRDSYIYEDDSFKISRLIK